MQCHVAIEHLVVLLSFVPNTNGEAVSLRWHVSIFGVFLFHVI